MADPSEPTRPASAAPGNDASAGSEIGQLSFEAALTRLEGIVDRLEEGDLELEVALSAFEEGVALSRRCAEQLARAERRIEVLTREGESWKTQPFEPDDDAPEEGD